LTLRELHELEYEELVGWSEYFRRRPIGWRADNRAAVIAMSFGGSKLKPEDLFSSLKTIQEDISASKNNSSVSQKFFDRFKHRFTEGELFDGNGTLQQNSS
jgi:hypothetical protein